MAGTKTNWHLDALDGLPDIDPMQQIEELKSEGKVIDLSRGKPEIMAALAASIDREAEFYDVGVSCDLKLGQDPPPCYQCSHYTENTEKHARALICALGREQVDLLRELDGLKALDRLNDELAAAHEAELAACEELAAAVL